MERVQNVPIGCYCALAPWAGRRAGLPPEVMRSLSAGSLRAAGATGAYLGGADLLSIAPPRRLGLAKKGEVRPPR